MPKKRRYSQEERRKKRKRLKVIRKYYERRKKLFFEWNEEYQSLLKKYNNDKKEIINNTKEKLEVLLLNLYLLWPQKIQPKKQSAFNYFSDLWVLWKASSIDFWWLKISQKYFDDLLK